MTAQAYANKPSIYHMNNSELHENAAGHFHENFENGLKFYSLNFNGILHVFDRI